MGSSPPSPTTPHEHLGSLAAPAPARHAGRAWPRGSHGGTRTACGSVSPAPPLRTLSGFTHPRRPFVPSDGRVYSVRGWTAPRLLPLCAPLPGGLPGRFRGWGGGGAAPAHAPAGSARGPGLSASCRFCQEPPARWVRSGLTRFPFARPDSGVLSCACWPFTSLEKCLSRPFGRLKIGVSFFVLSRSNALCVLDTSPLCGCDLRSFSPVLWLFFTFSTASLEKQNL